MRIIGMGKRVKKCRHKHKTYTNYIMSNGFNGVKTHPISSEWGTADGFECRDCNQVFKAERRFPL